MTDKPKEPREEAASLEELEEHSYILERLRRYTDSLMHRQSPSAVNRARLLIPAELAELRHSLEEQRDALIGALRAEITAKEKETKIRELEQILSALREKERLSFVLGRVSVEGQQALLQNEEFRKAFLEQRECEAFVMSVDIRRSTELMLKARAPEEFATFITNLASGLMTIITDNYGVFDKFTGDGTLAFFPDFYAGQDAGYYAVRAASEAHALFDDTYRRARSSFNSVLTDIGLGVGIDYGNVHLVQVAGGLTVVGGPVVYACRLSDAPPGKTYLNQPAYEAIVGRFGGFCYLDEVQLEIKHEGRMLAYEVRLSPKEYDPDRPQWTEGIERESQLEADH